MQIEKKIFVLLLLLSLIPVGISVMATTRFRYPCQDPENWEKQICKLPTCDVTRTCPEHIFKGQRDPRLGPPPGPAESINNVQCLKGKPDGK